MTRSEEPHGFKKKPTYIFKFSFHRNALSIVSTQLIENRTRTPPLVLRVYRSLSGALLFVFLIVRLIAATGRAGTQIALAAAHIVRLFGKLRFGNVLMRC